MKVLHFLHSNHFSGAENVVCQIISMMADEDIEFVYVSRDGQIREALEERGVKFVSVKDTSFTEYVRVLREEKPSIVHAHDIRACVMAAAATRFLGNAPLIFHVHNNHMEMRKTSVKAMLFHVASQCAKHIFWVSQSAYNDYVYKDSVKGKSSVLYNIVDMDKVTERAALDDNSYSYDMVYCGRLVYQKNPKRLLEVYREIAKQRPETTFAIVGEGEFLEEIRGLAAEFENVDVLGYMPNPYKLIADSKVMLMTSFWEGTPMVALEAMSLGTPIVSTPTDGLNDLICHGVTGYLEEQTSALANDVVNLLNNPIQQEAVSKAAQAAIAKRMDKESYKGNILVQYLAYYRK